MMRLIDADELEKTGVQFETHGGATFIALGNVRSAPTIDPASLRPKGEWVFDRVTSVEKFEVVKCSNCDYEAFAQAIHVRFGNFCPNCGADMRGDT